MHPFESVLSVSSQEIEFELRGIKEISWANFWLNPRKIKRQQLFNAVVAGCLE
jgi:hypothetical protein